MCFGSGRGTRALARQIEESILQEIARLETILNVHRPDSELSRWATTYGDRIEVSVELADVLEAAEHWRHETHGAFDAVFNPGSPGGHPMAPDTHRWRVERDAEGGQAWATKLVDGPVNPDGIAKGYVVDAACRAGYFRASAEGCEPGFAPEVMVNVGGDLRHMGPGGITAAVVDPFADAENAPPVALVQIAGQGMATSGGYRRGAHVNGRWMSHIMDPRSGLPVERIVSASVVAATAATADALATTFSVLEPEESLAIAERMQGVSYLLILQDGTRVSGGRWSTLRV